MTIFSLLLYVCIGILFFIFYFHVSNFILDHYANNKIKNEGFIINNIDSTIVLEKPRLAQHIPDIVQSLSKILDLDRSKICVKATTTDGLGFIGNELGWGVLAIVSISNQ